MNYELTLEEKKLLLEGLLAVQLGVSGDGSTEEWCRESEFGICTNLKRYLWEVCEVEKPSFLVAYIDNFFHTWEHYSGCDSYPVPEPKPLDNIEKYKPLDSYLVYSQTTDKWVGEYGNLRLNLLEHIIQNLSGEIAVEEGIYDEERH